MIDWTLEEVIWSLAKGFDARYAHCPQCGARFLHDFVYSVFEFEQAQCITKRLASSGIETVRQLVDSRPIETSRKAELYLDEVCAIRLAVRLWLWNRHSQAEDKLAHGYGLKQRETDKLGRSLAIELAFGGQDDNWEDMEVVVEMRDRLPFEQVAELPSVQQITLRREHADRTQLELTRVFELGEARPYLQLWLSNQLVLHLNRFDVVRVAQRDDVSRVTLSLPVRACVDEAFPRVCSSAIAQNYFGKDQVVALIDSGIDSGHPDLNGRVAQKKDYVGTGFADEHGHGTHLAGIVGAKCNSYRGVAPEVTLWAYRALDKKGESATQANLITAIQDLVVDASIEERTVVANCSFEVPMSSFADDADYDVFCQPFDDATSSIIVVTAAGNGGPEASSITAPGGGFRVLTVGASVNRPAGSLNVVSPFSSRGPATARRQKPDVVAPGGFANPEGDANANVSMISSRVAGSTLDILSSREKPWQVDKDHYGISGTSQSAALVSGVCALLVEHAERQNRKLKHYEIASALKNTARPLGYSRQEEGFGLINVDAAMKAV
jgi:serine protease AprX